MKYLMVVLSLCLAARAEAQLLTPGEGQPPTSEYSKPFFVEDIAAATDLFEGAMQDEEQFDDLANFLHAHPARYAALMTEFSERLKTRPLNKVRTSEWTDYLHRKTRESKAFAVKSAIGWRKGWGETAGHVVGKLAVKDFPSTRRIAIEFLKRENGGHDFGYRWKDKPDSMQNRAAILRWKSWLEHWRQT